MGEESLDLQRPGARTGEADPADGASAIAAHQSLTDQAAQAGHTRAADGALPPCRRTGVRRRQPRFRCVCD
jgi:hypothetical protein